MTPAVRQIIFGAYDPDAQDYFNRVEALGGSLETSKKKAVNNRARAAKAHGIWAKTHRWNLYCTDTFSGLFIPLKAGSGSASDTNANFVSGDYSPATGLTGNGTNKYSSSTVLANALAANDTHFAIYNRSSTDAQGGYCGVTEGANQFSLLPPYSDGDFYSLQYALAGGGSASSPNLAAPFGFLVGSRTTGTEHAIYRNGVSLASNGTNAGALPTLAIFIFARNLNGAADSFMSSPLAAYRIGSGLTASEVAADYADEQEFQTALGRQV